MVSSLNIFNIEQNLVNIVKESTKAIFKILETKMMNNECDKFTNLQFFWLERGWRIMFSDSNAADRSCINIPSNWKREKNLTTGGCQTDKSKTSEQETQVALYQEVHTQTESKPKTRVFRIQ